jgi:hypothetical protein
MAWEYGTDWVGGCLANQRRYVTGPTPANVSLWPIARLTHPESEEEGEEGGGEAQSVVGGPQGGAGPQNVTASSGPVMSPPSIVPPVEAPTVPTVISTPTVAPAAGATPPSTVPTTQPTAGRVSTTGAQLPRERPPTTEERHPKQAATEAAATLQTLQLAAGGGPIGPPATVAATRSQADQQWEGARAEVRRLWALGQQLQGEAQTKTTYTGFREVATMAQNALEAADAASRQAREERMASVGALPMTGLQLPRALEVVEPSEQLKADCQDHVQTLAQEILRRGVAARAAVAAAAGQGSQRPVGETGARASRGATQPGTMLPPPTPTRTTGC